MQTKSLKYIRTIHRSERDRKICDAISILTNKIQFENVPAQEIPDEAQQVVREALDEALNK